MVVLISNIRISSRLSVCSFVGLFSNPQPSDWADTMWKASPVLVLLLLLPLAGAQVSSVAVSHLESSDKLMAIQYDVREIAHSFGDLDKRSISLQCGYIAVQNPSVDCYSSRNLIMFTWKSQSSVTVKLSVYGGQLMALKRTGWSEHATQRKAAMSALPH